MKIIETLGDIVFTNNEISEAIIEMDERGFLNEFGSLSYGRLDDYVVQGTFIARPTKKYFGVIDSSSPNKEIYIDYKDIDRITVLGEHIKFMLKDSTNIYIYF